jgi:hypothetical protein
VSICGPLATIRKSVFKLTKIDHSWSTSGKVVLYLVAIVTLVSCVERTSEKQEPSSIQKENDSTDVAQSNLTINYDTIGFEVLHKIRMQNNNKRGKLFREKAVSHTDSLIIWDLLDSHSSIRAITGAVEDDEILPNDEVNKRIDQYNNRLRKLEMDDCEYLDRVNSNKDILSRINKYELQMMYNEEMYLDILLTK